MPMMTAMAKWVNTPTSRDSERTRLATSGKKFTCSIHFPNAQPPNSPASPPNAMQTAPPTAPAPAPKTTGTGRICVRVRAARSIAVIVMRLLVRAARSVKFDGLHDVAREKQLDDPIRHHAHLALKPGQLAQVD